MTRHGRVLMITQALDRDDALLGFTHDWVVKLADRLEQLVVVARTVADDSRPDTVVTRSLGDARGAGRLGVYLRLLREIVRHLRSVDSIFVHMVPRFAWVVAPLAQTWHRPIVLWYTHRAASPELRLATHCASRVVTAHRTSFPFPSPKVLVTGHGVDTARFRPPDEESGDGLRPLVLTVGRISPIKRHHVVVDAARQLQVAGGSGCPSFEIAGLTPEGDTSYREHLRARAGELPRPEGMRIATPIPPRAMPGHLHRAAVAVNLSPPGLFDKSALEAMACGVPTVIANPAFDDLLGEHSPLLRLRPDDGSDEALARALATAVDAVLRLPASTRRAMGLDLRRRVVESHDLDKLADRLVAVLAPRPQEAGASSRRA